MDERETGQMIERVELMTPAVEALFQQAVQTYHLPVVLP